MRRANLADDSPSWRVSPTLRLAGFAHPTNDGCICLMGSHIMAVVDDELKLHGLEALRVIDASVMPAVTSTNTNAPTITIAKKGAAIIKGTAQQRLAA